MPDLHHARASRLARAHRWLTVLTLVALVAVVVATYTNPGTEHGSGVRTSTLIGVSVMLVVFAGHLTYVVATRGSAEDVRDSIGYASVAGAAGVGILSARSLADGVSPLGLAYGGLAVLGLALAGTTLAIRRRGGAGKAR